MFISKFKCTYLKKLRNGFFTIKNRRKLVITLKLFGNMEKFAVDLDKVLDEFEFNEGKLSYN